MEKNCTNKQGRTRQYRITKELEEEGKKKDLKKNYKRFEMWFKDELHY